MCGLFLSFLVSFHEFWLINLSTYMIRERIMYSFHCFIIIIMIGIKSYRVI